MIWGGYLHLYVVDLGWHFIYKSNCRLSVLVERGVKNRDNK